MRQPTLYHEALGNASTKLRYVGTCWYVPTFSNMCHHIDYSKGMTGFDRFMTGFDRFMTGFDRNDDGF